MRIAVRLPVAASIAVLIAVAACGSGSGRAWSDCKPFSTSAIELVITETDSGRCFSARPGSTAQLRLPYGWSAPRSSGAAIQLIPIEYFRDPGYSAWVVRAVKSGSSTISASRPCTGADCAKAEMTFEVTIAVSPPGR